MSELLKQFRHTFVESCINLIPILIIIVGFQALVFQSVPENVVSIAIGFFIVVVGVTFFLMGLEIGVFPPWQQPLGRVFGEKVTLLVCVVWICFGLWGFHSRTCNNSCGLTSR